MLLPLNQTCLQEFIFKAAKNQTLSCFADQQVTEIQNFFKLDGATDHV